MFHKIRASPRTKRLRLIVEDLKSNVGTDQYNLFPGQVPTQQYDRLLGDTPGFLALILMCRHLTGMPNSPAGYLNSGATYFEKFGRFCLEMAYCEV